MAAANSASSANTGPVQNDDVLAAGVAALLHHCRQPGPDLTVDQPLCLDPEDVAAHAVEAGGGVRAGRERSGAPALLDHREFRLGELEPHYDVAADRVDVDLAGAAH